MSASEPPQDDYRKLADALAADDLATSAAEVHGALTGMLSAPQMPTDWQQIALGEAPLPGSTLPALIEQLRVLTETQLRSEEFSFEPLLAPEDAPLDQQVEALASWCSGFVLGLGSAGGPEALALSAESREIVEDFLRIGEAVLEEADEEGARALAELAEFVRIGAQTVYDERHRNA